MTDLRMGDRCTIFNGARPEAESDAVDGLARWPWAKLPDVALLSAPVEGPNGVESCAKPALMATEVWMHRKNGELWMTTS